MNLLLRVCIYIRVEQPHSVGPWQKDAAALASVHVLEITYIFCNTHYFSFFNQMPRTLVLDDF